MAKEALPSFQRAIRQGDDDHACVDPEAPLPSLPSGYVLVKTLAVAINHSDHKVANKFPIPGAYIGTDFCGTVVQAADDVDIDALKLGTMVSGACFCFSPSHRGVNGAFAEYVRTRADLLLRVPIPSSSREEESKNKEEDIIGVIEAATLGTALPTCLIALWSPEALGLSGTPDAPRIAEKPEPVLVYGGSTSTGTIAIQLLKLSGYDPIATCSPRNFDLVRDRGASAVFDYSAPDVVEKIKTHTCGRLRYVLDCISDFDSVGICYGAMQRPGGRYASLELVPDELLAKRRAVQPAFVLAAEVCEEEVILGQEGYDRPASKEKHDLAIRCMGMFQRLIDQGRLRAHPIEVLDGGLQAVVGGLQVLASGSGSGKKLVAIVDEQHEAS